MDINKENNTGAAEGEEKAKEPAKTEGSRLAFYKLTFGPLIEDMLVWLGLFFLLYNILPITLYVHNTILKGL